MSGKRKLDPRSVLRVLDAASRTEARNAREAAIVGGIVRSLLDTGHFRPAYARHYAPEILRWFADDIAKMVREGYMAAHPSMEMPTEGEVAQVVQRFVDRYKEPPAEPVAA